MGLCDPDTKSIICNTINNINHSNHSLIFLLPTKGLSLYNTLTFITMENTNSDIIAKSPPNELPSLVIWKLEPHGRQDTNSSPIPKIFYNFVEAWPLEADKEEHVRWIITKTSGKLKKDEPFPIWHHFEVNRNGDDMGPKRELDDEHTQERFTMGMLSHIHGFHGKYALITITALDLEQNISYEPLYWIDSNFVDMSLKMASKAQRSRFKFSYFTLHPI